MKNRDCLIYVLCILFLINWMTTCFKLVYIIKKVDEAVEERGYMMWRDVKYYPAEEVISGDK